MLKRLSMMLCLTAIPNAVLACACGCGVFDVGTASMLPTGEGGTVWVEYNFMNQGMNWSGNKVAPEADNEDKRLRTQVYTAGMQYMFNRSWGVVANVPYLNRSFRTEDDLGDAASSHKGGLGDVRIKAVYSGFSSDMSSGVTFGLKLPTGDHHFAGFDRDTDIGTGSTDTLLGAYHMGRLSADNKWSWFANGQWEHPVLTQGQYRPGDEGNLATGVYYNVGSIGAAGELSPLLQLIVTGRQHDRGANAAPDNSGYERVLIAPGVEYDVLSLKLYGDVELPLYQHVNGNQLVAPVYFKFIVGYNF